MSRDKTLDSIQEMQILFLVHSEKLGLLGKLRQAAEASGFAQKRLLYHASHSERLKKARLRPSRKKEHDWFESSRSKRLPPYGQLRHLQRNIQDSRVYGQFKRVGNVTMSIVSSKCRFTFSTYAFPITYRKLIDYMHPMQASILLGVSCRLRRDS